MKDFNVFQEPFKTWGVRENNKKRSEILSVQHVYFFQLPDFRRNVSILIYLFADGLYLSQKSVDFFQGVK